MVGVLKVNSVRKFTYMQLLMLQISIALAVYFFPFSSKILFVAIAGLLLFWIIINSNKNDEALIAAAYIVGAEVFFRMSKGLIFYESGKYLVILFLLFGLLYKGTSRQSIPYWIYLFLLIPGILFSAINLSHEVDVRKAVSFNLSGPITVGIVGVYCFFRKITTEKLHQIMLAALLPLVTLVFYLLIYTPSLQDSLMGTSSNFAASGGFGPNQVATVVGLGIIILFIRLFTVKSRLVNIIDAVLVIFFCYRGLATFSRGGMITAVICIIGFLAVYFYYSDVYTKAKLFPKLFLVGALIAFTWVYTSLVTGGLIDKRYKNQDAAGRLKEDITTGRAEVMTSEIEAFLENPITGVGVGKVKEYREEQTGISIATHNEISRILSEHGLFGLFAFLIILLSPLIYWIRYRPGIYFFSFYFFWLLTIIHSSMRLAAPAFIYGLCLLYVINEKNTLHRKPVKFR
ncbi:MAG TPA: O-antigen ligase family protein [Flavobacteriaceae bacterium]|nr:O-antigen ligase family protein [Flavobacteriaceae bacterium]